MEITPPAPPSSRLIPPQYLIPFVLVAVVFPLWGFANDITNPMVKAFSRILLMSDFEGSLVQFAFCGGYFAMAFPAAMFIKRFTYKSGILVGLGLYATGALLFIPASMMMAFWPFLVAYFILTCGLSFLETTANPYILSMGSEETAPLRLNVAQAFNPLGSLLGMFTAQQVILARLNSATQAERAALPPEQLAAVTASDLTIIRGPYVGIALVIILFFVVIAIMKMPHAAASTHRLDLRGTVGRLLRNKRYREGVVAQFFYIAAQIMCWTFIMQYGTEVLMGRGMAESEAEVAAQGYNIVAMIIFAASRFTLSWPG
ncbi:MAG: L-fucose:H+ symporter permease [Chthoniobacterales bacterium]|nr:L-fucose:H+ symporter permease [Chthoniobacterales bacterium]